MSHGIVAAVTRFTHAGLDAMFRQAVKTDLAVDFLLAVAQPRVELVGIYPGLCSSSR